MNAKQDSASPTQRGRIPVRFPEIPVDRFEIVVNIQNEYLRKSNCVNRRLGRPVGSR